MHALSKKHYYDVMKSSLEDTILESDISKDDYEREITPTLEVGCYARAHLKSNAVQTHWSRNNKNFRNEFTNTTTSDNDSVAMTPNVDSRTSRGGRPIHHCRSCEGSQAVSNQRYPLLKNEKTAVVESAVEYFECFKQKKRVQRESKGTITANFGDEECTRCKCMPSPSKICNCDEYRYIPSNRGLAACRTFTLGSSESRILQNEHSKSKLIGGCRVPVSKDYKSRF